MSGIAGFFNRDGAPADGHLLARMAMAVAHRGTDGEGTWTRGPIALAHRVLHTTPESLLTTQPLVDHGKDLCISMDGRIDNREELYNRLSGSGIQLRSNTDAEIVLAAYKLWGADCTRRLLGDFAFALWDSVRRRLFCARDVLGLRPFYYFADRDRFFFGSELQQLLLPQSASRETNEGMVGEYLANSITTRDETLYRGLMRLPPAHYLIVNRDHLTIQRYWDVDLDKEIRYRCESDYVEHLEEILQKAVRCRLRSNGKVAVSLSGGLDSAAVATIAISASDTGAGGNDPIEAFSLCFPGMGCDERPQIERRAAQWGLRAHLRDIEPPRPGFYGDWVSRSRDFPDYPNLVTYLGLSRMASQGGVRVLLTGCGADDWLDNGLLVYADMVHDIKPLAMLRQLAMDIPAWGLRSTWRSAVHRGLRPNIPGKVRSTFRRIWPHPAAPDWINEHFAKSISLADRTRPRFEGQRFASFAQRELYQWLHSGYFTQYMESWERLAGHAGLEERHPFQDRRVVEFAMALPAHLRWFHTQTKPLLRHVLKQMRPEDDNTCFTDVEGSPIYLDALQACRAAALLRSPGIAERGWINASAAQQLHASMLARYQSGHWQFACLARPVWMICGMELWHHRCCQGQCQTAAA